MAPGLKIFVTADVGTATVELRGELDLFTVGSLLSCVAKLGNKVSIVRLELSGLGFLDSMGISALLGLHRRLAVDLKSLEVVNLRGQPLRVLEMTGLTEQLNVG